MQIPFLCFQYWLDVNKTVSHQKRSQFFLSLMEWKKCINIKVLLWNMNMTSWLLHKYWIKDWMREEFLWHLNRSWQNLHDNLTHVLFFFSHFLSLTTLDVFQSCVRDFYSFFFQEENGNLSLEWGSFRQTPQSWKKVCHGRIVFTHSYHRLSCPDLSCSWNYECKWKH